MNLIYGLKEFEILVRNSLCLVQTFGGRVHQDETCISQKIF